MPRQTITISEPNHSWLQDRIDSGEFKTHTEAVNDALRRMREIENGVDEIRAKLIRAEQRGFSVRTPEQILAKSKSELRQNGEL
jgi:antitoxin ParD1/3/4